MCESTPSLASFRLDPGDGRWTAWCGFHFDEEVDFVEIEKATRYCRDEDVGYEFRHAIRDVTVDGSPAARPPTNDERAAVQAALFPHGPPPRVAKPGGGRFSNPRFDTSVAFPAEFAAIPRFRDGDWNDGILIPLPGGRYKVFDRVVASFRLAPLP